MSSQHQQTNQLGKNKPDERSRVTHNIDNNDTTTRRRETSISIDSCLGPRTKRKRLCSKNTIGRTDSLDNLLVGYGRKAKEVIRENEKKYISDNCKSHNETNNNSRKENFNNNTTTTNNNKRVHRTTITAGSVQTVYGEGNDTDKVDGLVTKSNDYSNNESQRREIISTRGGEEKKSGCFQFKGKVVNKSSSIKGLSSTKANKNKKDQQKKREEIIIPTIKNNNKKTTPSSLKKKIISGSVPTTTQRTNPHRKTHRERKWNNKWKLDFPWLEKGINHNGREVGMCLYCRSAEKKNSFANDGSTNLQYSAFQRHQTNREHRQAILEKQTLKQETVKYSTNDLKTDPVSTECVSTTLPPSTEKQQQNKVIKQEEELLNPPSSDFFNLTNQSSPAPLLAPSMVQPVYSPPSSYQHGPITSHPIDSVNKTQSSRLITSFYDDDNDDQNTPASPQRVFLLSKKASPLQLSGDVLIFQEGLESWTTSSGISSLIESLEGCSAAATTTSIAPSRTIVSEELPSFSFTSVKSPTPFKKAYVESEHADGILKSLSWLWRTNKLCDAVICSGETKIMLHRLILFAVSPHLLEKNIRDGAELEVNLPSGINDEALATFVAFLYDGVLNLTEYNYKDIERVGNLLRVEKVQRYCREFANSLAEYKLHQQLPMPVAPVIDGGNHEYVGKRKRGRPSKQTVVLNLGDEHSLGDRLDPSHYLQSGELSNYHNMSLSGSAISRMNSDMPVVFPDSQEYCLPSTSQTAQLFPSNQGHVKTEPYQPSQEFCSPFRINPKGSKSNSKEDADHISSFVMHETSGKSSTTMDIQTTTTTNNNSNDEDNNSTTANNSNNDDNGKNSTSSTTSEKNSNSKSNTKSLGSPSSKGDGGPSEALQSSPYPANVVASSGDGFSLYSLASS